MTRLLLALFLFSGGAAAAPGSPGINEPMDWPAGTADDTRTPALTLPVAPNILLLIADDLGVDQMALYRDVTGLHDKYASTPTFDALCDDGIRFERAWAQPTCKPSRGNLMTGRYGFRTGVLSAGSGQEIDPAEITLPMLLNAQGYRTANIGKWHLGYGEELGETSAPNTMGWSHFNGHLGGEVLDYYSWGRTEDGEKFEDHRYLTSAQVDDALAWLDSGSLDEPWLLWMAFTAPHNPLHLPPSELHDRDELTDDEEAIAEDPGAYSKAMVEALDTETARLLEALEAREEMEDTIIIFLGDNGTTDLVAQETVAESGTKGSLGQGGLWVPMCARGPGLPVGVSTSALVHVIDVFSTAVALSGATLDDQASTVGQDGLSLTPLLLDPTTVHRETLYSETDRLYGNVGGVALRGDRYKIIVQDDGVEAMFDLTTDPWEEHDLIDQLGDDEALQAAYDDLLDYLVVLHGGTVDTEGDSGSENGCSGCGATPRPPSLVWSLALLGVALRRRS